jgi:hypothetical protein
MKMKKLVSVLFVVLMLTAFLVAAVPAWAHATGWGPPGDQRNATGDGPPGWSYVSWGNGGSGSPGEGPGSP